MAEPSRPRRRSSTMRSRPKSDLAAGIIALPDLLQTLSDAVRTGTLVVTSGQRTAYVYLVKGSVAAAFDGDEEFLGKALIKSRALDWNQLASIQQFFSPTPATLGEVLLEQELVKPGTLVATHELAIRETMCELLAWSSPATSFHEDCLPELVRVGLPHPGVATPTKPLVMLACCSLDELRRIRADLPSDRDVFVAHGPPTGVRAPLQQEVLALVDGVRDLAEIVALARMPHLEALSSLWELQRTSRVRRLERDELLAVVPLVKGWGDSRERDKLVRIYERLEELGLDSPEVSLWLAQAQEAQGDAHAACKRYIDLGLRLTASAENAPEGARVLRRALALPAVSDPPMRRRVIEALIEAGLLDDAAAEVPAYVEALRQSADPVTVFRTAMGVLDSLQEFDIAQVLLAELALEAGDRAQALRLYRRVAEARLASDQFEHDEKAAVIERILALDPNDHTIRFCSAALYAEVDPPRRRRDLELFVQGARASRTPGAPPDTRVIEAYEALHALAPSPPVVAELADAYLDAGRVAEAAALLRDLVEADGGSWGCLLAPLERLVSMDDRPDHRFMLASALLAAGSGQRGLAQMLEVARRDVGERGRALELCLAAIRHAPADRGARSALVALLDRPEDLAARLEHRRALVQIARLEGALDEAIAALELYVAEAPEDHAAAHELIQLQVSRGGQALTHLASFARRSAEAMNLGDVAWAVRQAVRLEAPPAWFLDLSVPHAARSPATEEPSSRA